MPNSDMTGHWAGRLRDLATEQGVPGATLGIWADGQEGLAAHGLLNAATGVNSTPGSLFQIGSITKLWTATMIMQLAGEGRLSLDATVSDVLPDVPVGDPDAAAEITIRQLLTHSSGIDGDIFSDTGRGADCLERYVGELAGAARIFPPGAAYSYCNSGFVLLGRIIEVLDGREWDASLRERLIRPLNLTTTVTLPEQAILHRAAVGHRERPRSGEPVSVWGLPRSIGPAGNIIATAGDLLTFARMHLDGGVSADGTRVLAADLVTAMQQVQLTVPAGGRIDAVGLAWRLFRWDGGTQIIGHDGNTVGQTAFLRMDPSSRVAACLLTNSPQPDPLMRRLSAEIFAEHAGVTMPVEPGPAPGPVDVDLQRHAGRYERTSRRFDVAVRDGQLHLVSSLTGALRRGAGRGRPASGGLLGGAVRVPQPGEPALDRSGLQPPGGRDAVPVYRRPGNAANRVAQRGVGAGNLRDGSRLRSPDESGNAEDQHVPAAAENAEENVGPMCLVASGARHSASRQPE